MYVFLTISQNFELFFRNFAKIWNENLIPNKIAALKKVVMPNKSTAE